ncbi:MAG TPA: carboxypeptidase-like regulatory domain-containing protein [Terracidiphilus sp.]|nr:carboxypeptidase-like regulatory domain-containing protein [Terracidiphilus sp.]
MKLPVRRCWILLPVLCGLVWTGCDRTRSKKPDPTKGSVNGTVICADTDKPARFATVTLVAIPHEGEPAAGPADVEQGITDLNGQFDLEAVPPGRYYAYATLNGYLDPEMSLDFDQVQKVSGDHAQLLESIKQWKDHLAEVSVHVRRQSTVNLSLERAAEISGTVTYDDGSPAIGMHFRAYRKNQQGDWTSVGMRLFGQWSLQAESDSRGHYNIASLPAGEYIICALFPLSDENTTTYVCLGNVLRRKNATMVKVGPGETATGQDIVIPLSGLYTVSGTVSVLADGHAPTHALVRLLYADDRTQMRQLSTDEDGSFSFQFIPQGNYILNVTNAGDRPDKDSNDGSSGSSSPGDVRTYASKEMPLQVQGDTESLSIQLVPASSAPNLQR